ncbi:uncharacterized protein LOC132061230 [Lycium ferocissimum]|uniref:uncharacterized protein LOC132061230 n=1 Tax=Lycium ferocissimum TaxID=112874 RepID=UPI00281565C0|nr:uncharacterized protein LOC132061230 [Lycium ferocissimum]
MTDFEQEGDDGTLRYQGRLCAPNVDRLRERIMAKVHRSRYSIHPGATKMYHVLKEVYWWNDTKKNVADYGLSVQIVSKSRFLVYIGKPFHKKLGTNVNLSTVFHPQTDGQAECTIQILEDMLRECVQDFKYNWDDHLPRIKFAYNNSCLPIPR